jgi:hypothetical protein
MVIDVEDELLPINSASCRAVNAVIFIVRQVSPKTWGFCPEQIAPRRR